MDVEDDEEVLVVEPIQTPPRNEPRSERKTENKKQKNSKSSTSSRKRGRQCGTAGTSTSLFGENPVFEHKCKSLKHCHSVRRLIECMHIWNGNGDEQRINELLAQNRHFSAAGSASAASSRLHHWCPLSSPPGSIGGP